MTGKISFSKTGLQLKDLQIKKKTMISTTVSRRGQHAFRVITI